MWTGIELPCHLLPSVQLIFTTPFIEQSMLSSFLKCHLNNSLIQIYAVVLFWILNWIILSYLSFMSQYHIVLVISVGSGKRCTLLAETVLINIWSQFLYKPLNQGVNYICILCSKTILHKGFALWISHTHDRL